MANINFDGSREFCDICKISGFFCLLGSEELGY